jgi:hypothetical protein
MGGRPGPTGPARRAIEEEACPLGGLSSDLVEGRGPVLEGSSEGVGEFAASADEGGGGAELAEHGGHPGFTEDGQSHADGGEGLGVEDGGKLGLDAFGQAAAALGFEAVSGVVGSGAAVVGGAEAHEDVGAHSVGLLGLGRAVGMMEGDGPGAGVGQGSDHGVGQGVEAAGLTDDHATAVEGARGMPQGFALADAGHGDGIAGPGPQAGEGGRGRRPAHGVGGQPGVALELEHGPLGVVPEDAVDPPGVEAQGAQPALKLGDVVAAEHRSGEVEQTVAQAVAGLHERRPGLGPTDAVHAQAPDVLEGTERGLGAGAEATGVVGGGVVAGARQAGLQIPDGLAGDALPEQRLDAPAYRNSASSWTSWPFPLAPIRRFLATPSWKSTRVGMLMTS